MADSKPGNTHQLSPSNSKCGYSYSIKKGKKERAMLGDGGEEGQSAGQVQEL